MSITVTSTDVLLVEETLTSNAALLDASDKKVKHKITNSRALGAATSPPATIVVSGEISMSGGAATLDLRAILGTNGITVDGNGLKVQEVVFRSKAGNANPITIVDGASNGYLIFGTSSGNNTLPAAGDWIHLGFNDSLADIDATHKTIDISGTGSQTLQYLIVMG